MKLPRRLPLPLALALVAVLAACGGDSQPSRSPTGATPSPSPSAPPLATGPCTDADLIEEARSALPALSGVPGRIAFVCQGQVWVMRSDGADHHAVTEAPVIDYDGVRLYRVPEDQPPTPEEIEELEAQMDARPRWLSDGRILFASIRDMLVLSAASETRRPFVGATELYLVSADGSELTRLTDYNLAAGSYPAADGFDPTGCPSPDFCFAGLLTLTPQAVSPDGATVAASATEIRFSECCFLTALIGLDPLAFQPAEPAGGPGEPRVVAFSWSPDGQRAAVVVIRGGFEAPLEGELVVRDLDGGSESAILRAGEGQALADMAGASWSPTSDLIAFCALSDPAGPLAVYVIEAAGGEPRELVTLAQPQQEGASQDCLPSWSPDGKYVAVDSGAGEILVVKVATGESARIALGGQPSWGPGQ